MTHILTHILGCKVNFADAQAVAGTIPFCNGGQAALVGTCCVTAEGEKQSRKEVRRAIREVGPQGKVYVSGCAARRNPDAFTAMGDNVVLIASEAANASGLESNRPGLELSVGDRTRCFLKVQDGCSSGCAYCVIPLVRGRPRSVPIVEVLKTAEAAVAAGFPELVVTGINVGVYHDGAHGLPRLLEELAAVKGLKRLRLSSIEINHVTPELLDVFERHPVICNHLHLPLQSGDDGVLEAMGRRYRQSGFARMLADVRQALPGVNLTTDVIVGFPTEDESAFANTVKFVEEAGFSKVHVFSYSPRSGTAAADWGDLVPPADKKERSRTLRELSRRLQDRHRQRKVGGLSEVLLESSLMPGVYGGYSSDYTRFLIREKRGRVGSLVQVRAESVTPEAVMGKVVSNE